MYRIRILGFVERLGQVASLSSWFDGVWLGGGKQAAIYCWPMSAAYISPYAERAYYVYRQLNVVAGFINVFYNQGLFSFLNVGGFGCYMTFRLCRIYYAWVLRWRDFDILKFSNCFVVYVLCMMWVERVKNVSKPPVSLVCSVLT